MTMLRFVPVMLALALSGCVSNPSYVVRDGGMSKEVQRDSFPTAQPPPPEPLAATVEDKIRIRTAALAHYGWEQRVIDAILQSKVFFGMTTAMVRESWGEPNGINRTMVRSGASEQWVYDRNRYAYFENGVLTTIQD